MRNRTNGTEIDPIRIRWILCRANDAISFSAIEREHREDRYSFQNTITGWLASRRESTRARVLQMAAMDRIAAKEASVPRNSGPDIALTFMWDTSTTQRGSSGFSSATGRHGTGAPVLVSSGTGIAAVVASPPKSIFVTPRPLDRCHPPSPVEESPRSRKYIATPRECARASRALGTVCRVYNTLPGTIWSRFIQLS